MSPQDPKNYPARCTLGYPCLVYPGLPWLPCPESLPGPGYPALRACPGLDYPALRACPGPGLPCPEWSIRDQATLPRVVNPSPGKKATLPRVVFPDPKRRFPPSRRWLIRHLDTARWATLPVSNAALCVPCYPGGGGIPPCTTLHPYTPRVHHCSTVLSSRGVLATLPEPGSPR